MHTDNLHRTYLQNNNTPKCQAGSYKHNVLVVQANYGFIKVEPELANACRNGLSDVLIFASGMRIVYEEGEF
jgi:hypothetical protein